MSTTLVQQKPVEHHAHHKTQTSKELTQPVPFTIPYDIWVTLISCLDFYTLESFALVCRDFKHEAEKHLWRSCTLYVPARLNEHWARVHLEEGCEILLRDGRASRVRDLRVDIQAFLGVNGSEEMRRTLNALVRMLREARRLTSLSVKSIHHRQQIARALSEPSYYDVKPQTEASPVGRDSTSAARDLDYTFRLERFATDLFCDEHLYPFWTAQSSSIRNVELVTVDSGFLRVAQTANSLPRYVPFPLPVLNTVQAAYAHHLSIVRDSPVTSIVLNGVWEGELALVRDHLTHVQPATLDVLLDETLPETAAEDSYDDNSWTHRASSALRDRSPSRTRQILERYWRSALHSGRLSPKPEHVTAST